MKRRRFLSLIVAMVMVMSSCLVAMATETDVGNGIKYDDETGANIVTSSADVSITDIPTGECSPNQIISFTTYQVLYATYDTTTNEIEYHLTNWAKSALVDADNTKLYTSEEAAIADIQAMTTDPNSSTYGGGTYAAGTGTTEQNTIVNTLATYIVDNPSTSTYTASWSFANATDSYTATASLPVGAYLVVPTSSDMAFLNMLVSVDATASDDPTANAWAITAHGAVLKGNPVTITKLVKETDSTEDFAESTNVQIGQKVTYSITVTVPNFDKDIPDSDIMFKIVDESENITIDEKSITVTPLASGATSGTAMDEYSNPGNTFGGYTKTLKTTAEGQELTIDLAVNYQSIFCNNGIYPYATVEITYDATLNTTADIASDANTNEATLHYGHDVDESSANMAVATADVYTYKAVLTKNGENTSTALAGAEFEITLNGTALKFIKSNSADDTYIVVDSNYSSGSKTYDVITTGSNGSVTILGLDADKTYTIKETKAPSGYSLNSHELDFTIVATAANLAQIYSETHAEYADSSRGTALSTGTSWTAVAYTTDNYLDLKLTDTKIPGMPSTGSIGIIIFTVLGVCLMIVAVFLMTSSKDKKKQAE